MDELRHRIQGAVLWIAMALAVTTRLWLGATVSLQRDKALIVRLVEKVKAAALCRPLLVCFDGFSAYLSACRQVFRTPVRTGKPGRPRLVLWPDIHLGQVIKQYAQRRVIRVERRIVQGSASAVASLLEATQSGTMRRQSSPSSCKQPTPPRPSSPTASAARRATGTGTSAMCSWTGR